MSTLYPLCRHLHWQHQPQPAIVLVLDWLPPSSNDETANHEWWLRQTHHITALDQYPPPPSYNVPLPSVANVKIAKTKMTILSMIVISNTTRILKMSISLSFLVKMDFVCRREAMLQPCIRPYLFGYTRTPLNLHSLSYASHIHMLTVITCYLISHVYYYLLCTMYL